VIADINPLEKGWSDVYNHLFPINCFTVRI